MRSFASNGKVRLTADKSCIRQRPPSLLACVACRKRHLKCNGEMPVCKRCQDNGAYCNYEQSRRGYKGPRKTKYLRHSENVISRYDEITELESEALMAPSSLSPAIASNDVSFMERGLAVVPPVSIATIDSAYMNVDFSGSSCQTSPDHMPVLSFRNLQRSESKRDRDLAFNPTSGYIIIPGTSHADLACTGDPLTSQETRPTPQSDTAIDFGEIDTLIDIFYSNFFGAHPFIIPKKHYRDAPSTLPSCLKAVVRFVASHFARGFPQTSLRNAAENITSSHVPNDGFKVQGLMLFGMSLFARCEQEPALVIINKAIDLALELRMNTNNFSIGSAVGDPILEESWRRTWWELYMMDGILASLSSVQYSMRLHNTPANVPLPCEEQIYANCKRLPPLRSQLDFQERAFAYQECDYSSLAYKIESVCLLGKVINLGPDIGACPSEQVGSLDASLANFVLSIPQDKRSPISLDGRIDEIVFSAQSIIDCAQIMLHRPRSNLVFVRNYYATPCTRQEAIGTPISPHEIHTSKAIKAANSISSSAALRSPLTMHSPCFVCAIAMAAVVHLPAYSMETNPERSSTIKERLQLSISALNSISEVWPTAGAAKSQISQFAREIFAGRAAAVESKRQVIETQQIDFDCLIDDQDWFDRLLSTPADDIRAIPRSEEERIQMENCPSDGDVSESSTRFQ